MLHATLPFLLSFSMTLTYSINPISNLSLEAVVALLRSSIPDLGITPWTFAARTTLDPNFDSFLALTATDDQGECIGFVHAVMRKPEDPRATADVQCGWIQLFATSPSHRHRGIASLLFDRIEQELRVRGVKQLYVGGYSPHYWAPGVDEQAGANAIRFLERRGYQSTSRPLAMEVRLGGDYSESAWIIDRREGLIKYASLGLELVAPATACELLQFIRDNFSEDWAQTVSAALSHIATGYRSPEDLLIAIKRGRIVGFAHRECERFGPFGVAASEQGQGIGGVLLSAMLRHMQNEGCSRAWFMWTGDDIAKRVYAPAGFMETHRWNRMRKTLT